MKPNAVQAIKEKYPAGTRIMLRKMNDPSALVEERMMGTVVYVDDQTQLDMQWDNGRTLSLVPGVDDFVIEAPFLEVSPEKGEEIIRKRLPKDCFFYRQPDKKLPSVGISNDGAGLFKRLFATYGAVSAWLRKYRDNPASKVASVRYRAITQADKEAFLACGMDAEACFAFRDVCMEVEDGEGHIGILYICQGEIDKYTPEYVENNVSLRYCSVTEEYYLALNQDGSLSAIGTAIRPIQTPSIQNSGVETSHENG